MSRGVTIAGIAAALLLALASGGLLLAAAYASFAERHLDDPRDLRAVTASRIAASLAPWTASTLALHAWLLMEQGDAGLARLVYHRALRLAPADALLWAEYAIAMTRLDPNDSTILGAVARAQQLAPSSPAIQAALAELGLNSWNTSSEELRTLWLSSMRHQLIYARTAFLGMTVARGQVFTFCSGPANDLGERSWCESKVPTLMNGCFDITDRGPAPC